MIGRSAIQVTHMLDDFIVDANPGGEQPTSLARGVNGPVHVEKDPLSEAEERAALVVQLRGIQAMVEKLLAALEKRKAG